jgi:hypothetical protein
MIGSVGEISNSLKKSAKILAEITGLEGFNKINEIDKANLMFEEIKVAIRKKTDESMKRGDKRAVKAGEKDIKNIDILSEQLAPSNSDYEDALARSDKLIKELGGKYKVPSKSKVSPPKGAIPPVAPKPVPEVKAVVEEEEPEKRTVIAPAPTSKVEPNTLPVGIKIPAATVTQGKVSIPTSEQPKILGKSPEKKEAFSPQVPIQLVRQQLADEKALLQTAKSPEEAPKTSVREKFDKIAAENAERLSIPLSVPASVVAPIATTKAAAHIPIPARPPNIKLPTTPGTENIYDKKFADAINRITKEMGGEEEHPTASTQVKTAAQSRATRAAAAPGGGMAPGTAAPGHAAQATTATQNVNISVSGVACRKCGTDLAAIIKAVHESAQTASDNPANLIST